MGNPEEHFPDALVDRIVERLFATGCVLLRGFTAPENVVRLRDDVETLYDATTGPHVFEQDFLKHALPSFRDYLFEPKHYALLDAVFAGRDYQVYAGTHARRIQAPLGKKKAWQQPLCYHIDALFHRFMFTVNFWVPLNDCGVTAPSLAVVPAPFDEVLEFVGYDGRPEGACNPPDYYYNHFGPLIAASARTDAKASEQVRQHFGDRLWSPAYKVGDAMMLTNWTIHGTHVMPDMTESRQDVELRFTSNLTLSAIVEKQADRGSRLSREVEAI